MFCLTYGDGVSDVNITEVIEYHKRQKKLVTLTAIQPIGKFGALEIDKSGLVSQFHEKPSGNDRWVNGGFFVLSPKVGGYLVDDTTSWEREPLEKLSREGNVTAYKHTGFWQPMDTLHDMNLLESLWASGTAPWKVW